jgi:porin
MSLRRSARPLSIALARIIVAAMPAHAQSLPQPADLWGPVPTGDASIVNVAPILLPYFNNGSVFGLPESDVGDFSSRTQLSGDWGGVRTDLARHGFFFDLYSATAYLEVTAGGLKTGVAFLQNTQLSINIDTGRAGSWPGGLFHITVASRYVTHSPRLWLRANIERMSFLSASV